jgi:hypothetical protein
MNRTFISAWQRRCRVLASCGKWSCRSWRQLSSVQARADSRAFHFEDLELRCTLERLASPLYATPQLHAYRRTIDFTVPSESGTVSGLSEAPK